MRTTAFITLLSFFMACGSDEPSVNRLTPDVTVAPERVAFGDVVPGFTVEQTFHVVNAGRSTLEISDVSLGANSVFSFDYEAPVDDDGIPIDPIALDRSETMAVTVTFTPTDLDEYTSQLVITSNDEETPVLEVPISGTGVIGPQPDISIDVIEVDFGDVATGDVATEYILVNNEGDATLTVFGFTQEGSGAFSVVTDPSGQDIAPGGSATVLMNYSPQGTLSGHSGAITFLSDDPDEPEVSVGLRGGDGGPDDVNEPIAVISGDGAAAPPARIALDGSASTSGVGLDDNLEFSWTLVDKPAQSNAYLDDDTTSLAKLEIDIAGDYTVQLIVTDPETGVSSAPSRHTVAARPVEALYIALTWDKWDTDLDLHVVPNAGVFWGEEDISFCNPEMDWGERGLAVFSGDVSVGYGPESVTVTELADTSYHIGVHYFEDNRGASVTATVTIYLNGEYYGTFSGDLNHNYFWKAGYVRIDDGEASLVEHDDLPFFSSTRECSES